MSQQNINLAQADLNKAVTREIENNSAMIQHLAQDIEKLQGLVDGLVLAVDLLGEITKKLAGAQT